MALSLFTSDPLFSQMERVFDRSFDRAFKSLAPAAGPGQGAVVASCPFDITEHPDKYQLVAGGFQDRWFQSGAQLQGSCSHPHRYLVMHAAAKHNGSLA